VISDSFVHFLQKQLLKDMAGYQTQGWSSMLDMGCTWISGYPGILVVLDTGYPDIRVFWIDWNIGYADIPVDRIWIFPRSPGAG
jgi:hypothetical protein